MPIFWEPDCAVRRRESPPRRWKHQLRRDLHQPRRIDVRRRESPPRRWKQLTPESADTCRMVRFDAANLRRGDGNYLLPLQTSVTGSLSTPRISAEEMETQLEVQPVNRDTRRRESPPRRWKLDGDPRPPRKTDFDAANLRRGDGNRLPENPAGTKARMFDAANLHRGDGNTLSASVN